MPSRLILESEYFRERVKPHPRDGLFLHLSDLLLAIQSHRSQDNLKVLDYGAGSSPYRFLFPNASYFKADIGEEESTDIRLLPDGSIPMADGSFDLVISTQVVEHVPNSARYFKECYRVLKPQGKLLLTTHGLYEEHGCPFDYQRWTADGLARDISTAGFEIRSIQKLTTGPRAVLFFYDRYIDSMRTSRFTLGGMLYWLLRTLNWPIRGLLHRAANKLYSANRVVPSTLPGHHFYVVLLCDATRQRL
jgi:SAM-dependent methyltransferase